MRVVARLSLALGLLLGCGAPPERALADRLVLLHTSDLHSRVWPFRTRVTAPEAQLGLGPRGALVELGGWARLATLLARERAEGPRLWLDSGDALEGADAFHRFRGELELSLLEQMGLGAMALGNHELSLGAEELAALVATRARFPVLSANLTPAPGSALAGRVLPVSVLVSQGVRVGVIGVANASSPPDVARADNPWRLESGHTAAALQLAVERLTPLADVLVVLSHLGLDGDRELVAATAGVDLVLGGHQHIVTPEPEWQRDRRGRRVPIVHSGAYGKLLARLGLALRPDDAGPGLELASLALEHLPSKPSVAEDAELLARLEPLWPAPQPPLAHASEALLRRSALGGDSSLGNLVAEAMREAAGADVAILNSSSLRADLEPGPVLTSDVQLALPFDEPWQRLWVRARELRAALERSARRGSRECESLLQLAGLRLRVDCAACTSSGAACLSWWRSSPWGELPLRGDELLQVVLPGYLARSGADFEALASSSAEPVTLSAADATARYLRRQPPASAAPADDCVEQLQALTPQRCRETFGLACPPDAAQAARACRNLPRLSGARDGRITMLR